METNKQKNTENKYDIEKLIEASQPHLREIVFHSNGEVAVKTGGNAPQPKKLYYGRHGNLNEKLGTALLKLLNDNEIIVEPFIPSVESNELTQKELEELRGGAITISTPPESKEECKHNSQWEVVWRCRYCKKETGTSTPLVDKEEWWSKEFDNCIKFVGSPEQYYNNVKHFISKLLSQAQSEHNQDCTREEWARASERERILKGIEKMKIEGIPKHREVRDTYNQALEDIINLINKDNER